MILKDYRIVIYIHYANSTTFNSSHLYLAQFESFKAIKTLHVSFFLKINNSVISDFISSRNH